METEGKKKPCSYFTVFIISACNPKVIFSTSNGVQTQHGPFDTR